MLAKPLLNGLVPTRVFCCTGDWASFMPTPTGWELNARGKLGPRMMNLGPSMDPRQLAESAVDLNLKLMRWRAAPALDTARLAATKCLLLGAGVIPFYPKVPQLGSFLYTLHVRADARILDAVLSAQKDVWPMLIRNSGLQDATCMRGEKGQRKASSA